jgi:hypothetical protein
MTLKPNDLHFIFDRIARIVEAWNANHERVFSAEARNRATGAGYGHEGLLPPGEYVFGTPVPKNTAPFGPWFVPILDAPGHNELASRGRSGLGWHGGGSGLPDPLADHQSPPWVVTHGCERSINHDLRIGVALIQKAQAAGGICYVTNVPAVPGTSANAGDDWLLDSELDPDE